MTGVELSAEELELVAGGGVIHNPAPSGGEILIPPAPSGGEMQNG